MNQLEQLKQELKEKDNELETLEFSYDILNNEHTLLLKTIGLKGDSTHDEIVNKCEEILNSQQNKNQNSASGLVDEPRERFSSNEQKETGSADTEQEKAEGVVYPKGDSDTSPVQTLINQAVEQERKRILEIIRNCLDYRIGLKCGFIDKEELKQQIEKQEVSQKLGSHEPSQIEGEKSVEYLDRKKLGIGIKKGDKK